MPQFRYRAVTRAGEIVNGEVEAPSREEVVRRIEYLGHMTIDAEVATTRILARSRRPGGKPPRSRDVSLLLRQLALLLAAGLTLEAALQTLGDDTSKALAGFANGLRASISAGDSFAEALEHHSSIIEPAYVAMVRAGEESGNLSEELTTIADQMERTYTLKRKIRGALIYPGIIVCAIIGIGIFIAHQAGAF